MKTITLIPMGWRIVLCAALFSNFTLAQTPDFNIQHIQDDIGNTGGANSSISPVSSLNSAFVLANNNRKVSGGPNGSGATFSAADLSGARVLIGTNTINYFRQAGSNGSNMRFNSSIWEYIGPTGGPNEMIVRGRYVVSLNGTTNSVTQAISGISNANRCIPFITGIITNDIAAGADSGTALAYLENATTLRVQKGTNANNVSVYITVVEFTGSNWTVLHGDSGNTGSQTGTITLRTNSDGTGAAANVGSWNEAIIFTHHRGDNVAGLNQALEDNWPLTDPGANTQSVDWSFAGSYGSNGTNRHFVHVLSNSGLNVTRFQNLSNTAGNTNINISPASLSNVNEALIVGTSTTSGAGTAYGRGWRNYYLNSTTQAAHWAHRSGNAMNHEIQVVDLSGLTSATCASTISTFPYSEDFEAPGSGWINGMGDDFDWARDSGGTPSPGTGPTSGNGDTWYLYIEASSPNFPTLFADVLTPCFDLSSASGASFSYSYHMFGADVGSLDVDLSTNNGVTFPVNLRSFSGNLGNVWNTDTIDLTPYVGQVVMLRFRGTSGSDGTNGWSSDIAIDNVSLTTTTSGPEISVSGNSTVILDGDTTPNLADDTDYGNVITAGGTQANTFTIDNLGTSDLNLTGASPYITISGPNAGDFSVTANPTTPVTQSNFTTFEITFDPSADGIRTAAISIANNDSDENPYTFNIQGTGFTPAPEIDIQGNGVTIVDGDITPNGVDDTDFGNVDTISSQANTFTIQNLGTLNLNLTDPSPYITISGAHAGDFAVTGVPGDVIGTSSSTTFEITFTPSALGLREATISISNDDSDENPYTFDIQGTGIAPSYCNIAAGSESFEYIGNVTLNTINNSSAGGTTSIGYSDFTAISTSVIIGTNYPVSITPVWPTPDTYNEAYAVYIDFNQDFDFDDPGELVFTAGPDQVTPQTGNILIPLTATLGNTRMRVIMDDVNPVAGPCVNPNFGEVEDYTINITAPSPIQEIDIAGNTVSIADNDTTPNAADGTDFGPTETGTPITQTFTINNFGSVNDLILTGASPYVTITGADAADFSVSVTPSTPISALSSTTFEITFTPSTLGVKNATLTILNNDPDEGVYNFDIQGSGTQGPPEYTIYYEHFDAGDGGWTASTGSTTVWTYGSGLTGAGETGEGNYWYSNPFNTYTNNINITLTSPIISTAGYFNLALSIDMRYDFSADDDDGMRVEYRRRTSGVWSGWAVLGANGDGRYWYDGAGIVDALGAGSDGWTGSTDSSQAIPNYFQTASIPLPSILEDSAEIQFRFVMAADAATVDRGAAIDNIIINADPVVAFTDPTYGPGSINSDLKLWLKATEGWGVLNDGDEITNLPDAAFDNNATGLTANSPAFRDNGSNNINYNPVMEFDRSNQEYLRGKGGYFAQDYFVVMKSNGTIDNSATNRQVPIAGRVAPLSPQVDGTGLGLGNISQRFADEVVAHMSSSVPTSIPSTNGELSYGRALTSTTESYTDEVIIYNVKTNAAGDAAEIYKNGKRIDNTAGFAFDQGIPGFTDQLNLYEFENQQYYLGVGRFSLNGNIDAYVDGRITEIVSYKNPNSALDKQKIESYLALKNGVTLHATNSTTVDRENDIDYLDSQGNVIWDTSAGGYNYDIAGIGRDDDSNFLQKQSASENKFTDGTGLTSGFLSIGLSNVYDTNKENIDNNATNFNDREYLVWGNNNGDINAPASDITVNMSAGITPALTTEVTFTAMSRVWKVVESGGDIPEVEVKLPQNAIRNINPPGSYYMFISDTGVFDPTADYRVMRADGNGNLETTYDFDNTKYITFGYAPQVVVERSVYFDGAVDYVDMEDNLDLEPSGFTLSAWIKRDASDTGTKSILSKRDAAFTEGYDFQILNDNRIQIFWKNGSDQDLVSNTSIPDDEWHHVAAVYDGTSVYLYIDGVLDNDDTKTAPVATDESFYIAAAGKSTPVQHFRGNIDEVRVWNTALAADQLRFVMNQEIADNAGQAMGTALPTTISRNDINAIPWSDLAGYYPMSVYTYTNTDDASGNGNQGALRNLDTVDRQTAPLPYVTNQNGDWDTNGTWTNGNVQYIPGSPSIVDPNVTVDWNIVRTAHDITLDNSSLPVGNLGNRTVLGLEVQANELRLTGDNAANTGNGLTVSHYLRLTGKIDLEGESQLIQELNSDLIVDTNGELEKDQQGTSDTYTYNYWSAPVGETDLGVNNYEFTVEDIMLDGTNPVNFTGSGFDGSPTNPVTIADYWIWKFANLPTGDYSAWQHVRRTGSILAGEGFTMKGPGTGGILDDQNYVFLGKPNNGDINLTINANNDYLVGNPYPSAIDANRFILDNGPELAYDGSPDTTPLLSGTLYFWEHWGGGSHVLAEYQGGYATYNFSGAVAAASYGTNDPDVGTGGTPTKLPGRYIPVGQGFFVTGETTGTINFNNSQRIFVREGNPSSVFVRGFPGTTENDSNPYEEDNRMKFRIGFNSVNTIHRQLLLTVDENASASVDWAFDAKLNEIQMDDMFWLIDEGEYVIQGTNLVDDKTILPIGIRTDTDGNNVIRIDELENVPSEIDIYLHDKELQIYHDLRVSDYEIFLNSGEYLNRFEITFINENQALSADEEMWQQLDILYSNDLEKLVLINPNGIEIDNIELFNVIGQSVYTIEDISESGYSEYDVKNLSTGTYIVKLYAVSGSVSTKKVLVN